MIVKSTLIFFCLIFFFGYGQEHQFVNSKEVLMKNKVTKIFQYDASDSLKFIQKYPNGYYSIVDDLGRVVEANNYTYFITKEGETITREYKNYSFYDSLNNQIGFIQMFINLEDPFRIITLKSFDYNSNKIKTVNLEENNEYESKFVFREEEIQRKKTFFGDTISINKFSKRTYSVSDSSIYLDLFYNKKDQIDSSIFHNSCIGKNGSNDCYIKTKYLYGKDNVISIKTIENYSETAKSNPLLKRKIIYHTNGLVKSVLTEFIDSGTKEFTKYIYYYDN